ncbi:ABC transporter permease [Acetobacterium wieringae]|uniref:ABC transporter permease n=1 Tax=Acetobacterium wieringae TaxID=52694 RepID=UPI0026F050E4|nr:ABC transporter permease subunit [Acetobacterium wieringae]
MSLRTFGVWIVLAGITVFFFFTSNGRHALVETNQVEFMSIFLPQIIFGVWAVMSVYFDLISADREHNVLDCILSSGVTKGQVFTAKLITTAVISLLLSFIYLTPIMTVIAGLSDVSIAAATVGKYLFPFWGYIMVFAAMGVVISVLARSSKAAMIWSLACGLILMPRFFILIVDSIGAVFNLSEKVVNNLSLISPGVMMETLSNLNNIESWITATVGFSISVVLLFVIAYVVFKNQDEYNYGE